MQGAFSMSSCRLDYTRIELLPNDSEKKSCIFGRRLAYPLELPPFARYRFPR